MPEVIPAMRMRPHWTIEAAYKFLFFNLVKDLGTMLFADLARSIFSWRFTRWLYSVSVFWHDYFPFANARPVKTGHPV